MEEASKNQPIYQEKRTNNKFSYENEGRAYARTPAPVRAAPVEQFAKQIRVSANNVALERKKTELLKKNG